MKRKVIVSLILSMIMTASVLAGCGDKDIETLKDTEQVQATEAVEAEEPETETESEITEPETEEAETELPEEAAFTVTELSTIKYAKQSVNVRKGPSADYEKLGGLTINQKVTVTGQADTGWYRIEYNGADGYVSDKYLTDKKTVSTMTSGVNMNAAASVGSNTAGRVTGNNNSNSSGTSGSSNSSSNSSASGATGNSNNGSGNGSTGNASVGTNASGSTEVASGASGSVNMNTGDTIGNTGNTSAGTNTGGSTDTSGTPSDMSAITTPEQWEDMGFEVYDPSENVPGDNWVEMGGGITTGGGDSF